MRNFWVRRIWELDIHIDSYFGRHLKRLCNNREPERPKKDGKDFTVYPGLIFYKGKFDTAITELKKSRSISVLETFVVIRNRSLSTKSPIAC